MNKANENIVKNNNKILPKKSKKSKKNKKSKKPNLKDKSERSKDAAKEKNNKF
jgi:hypothetical protein